MTLFYLLDNMHQCRMILSTEVWPDSIVLKTIAAPSWLSAKKALGFPLTPMQESLLEEQQA